MTCSTLLAFFCKKWWERRWSIVILNSSFTFFYTDLFSYSPIYSTLLAFFCEKWWESTWSIVIVNSYFTFFTLIFSQTLPPTCLQTSLNGNHVLDYMYFKSFNNPTPYKIAKGHVRNRCSMSSKSSLHKWHLPRSWKPLLWILSQVKLLFWTSSHIKHFNLRGISHLHVLWNQKALSFKPRPWEICGIDIAWKIFPHMWRTSWQPSSMVHISPTSIWMRKHVSELLCIVISRVFTLLGLGSCLWTSFHHGLVSL